MEQEEPWNISFSAPSKLPHKRSASRYKDFLQKADIMLGGSQLLWLDRDTLRAQKPRMIISSTAQLESGLGDFESLWLLRAPKNDGLVELPFRAVFSGPGTNA